MDFEITIEFLGVLRNKLDNTPKNKLSTIARFAEARIPEGAENPKVKLYFCLVWLGFTRQAINGVKRPLTGGPKRGDYFGADWLSAGKHLDALSLGVPMFGSNRVNRLVERQEFTIKQLIKAGYSHGVLSQAFGEELEAALLSMSTDTLKEMGLDLKTSGFPASLLEKVDGIDVRMLNELFEFSPEELKSAGYGAVQLAWLGIDVVVELGFPPGDLVSAFGASWYVGVPNDVLAANGYNVLALKYSEYYAKFYSQAGKDCVCGGMENSSMYGVMPMPQKFDPSDGGSSFSRGRAAWLQNAPSNSLYDRVALNKAYKVAPSASRGGMPLPGTDASTVVQMRKIEALGKGTARNGAYRKDAPLSFCATNRSNANTVRQARRRARSSGNVVPPKVTAPREGVCAGGRIVA
jgi:hypothetical protein